MSNAMCTNSVQTVYKFNFPHAFVEDIYLDCIQSVQLKQRYTCILNERYPELLNHVFPLLRSEIRSTKPVFRVNIYRLEQFKSARPDDFKMWHADLASVDVPYGDLVTGYSAACDDLPIKIFRTMRNITRAIREIPNPNPSCSYWVNLVIPWIPPDINPTAIDTLKDEELNSVAECVLLGIAQLVNYPKGQVIFDSTEITPCVFGCKCTIANNTKTILDRYSR